MLTKYLVLLFFCYICLTFEGGADPRNEMIDQITIALICVPFTVAAIFLMQDKWRRVSKERTVSSASDGGASSNNSNRIITASDNNGNSNSDSVTPSSSSSSCYIHASVIKGYS
jgi:hypothetical protein